jgi:hypothetical protein
MVDSWTLCRNGREQLLICKGPCRRDKRRSRKPLKQRYIDYVHERTYEVRAALHLEAGPIRCVRGLKPSLVIGQKAQIGPNPFTPRGRADLVV